ncbi:MAG: slipin family protein [Patescibacteria group bacterium]|jgi:regulator of protease activity HflC (stomatin/prohibitin superfamily)|nr:slipin family protein [Patescibacteria group bacterium]
MEFLIIIISIILIVLIIKGIRIINQYERGVIFRLGKAQKNIKEPGIRFIIPFIDRIRIISLRIVTLPVESQKIITKDNVSIDVAAVAYYKIQDPTKSVIAIQNAEAAIYQIAQTTVRNVIGQSLLDVVLSNTTKINNSIKGILDKVGEQWGVYVSAVELKDIQLPIEMQSAMAAEAVAEREKRAKIIAAEGEQLSAGKLAEAADIINKHPIALQLRNLQVLTEISSDKNSTIIFPAQFMDTVQSVKNFIQKESK